MPDKPEELADAAFDPREHDRVAEAIQQLTPEEAQLFLEVLEKALWKRKIQLWGYLAAGVTLIVGMTAVLLYWGAAPEGTFIGWTIAIPFALVGIILWGFGRWSNKVG